MEFFNLVCTLSCGALSAVLFEFDLVKATAFLILWTFSWAANDSDNEGFLDDFSTGAIATTLLLMPGATDLFSDFSLSKELFEFDLFVVEVASLLFIEAFEGFLCTVTPGFCFLLDSVSLEPKQFDDERLTIGGLDDLAGAVWVSAHWE